MLSVTLNEPDAGVVRPMTPTAEPAVGGGAVSARAANGEQQGGRRDEAGQAETTVGRSSACRLAATPQVRGLSHYNGNGKSRENNTAGRPQRGARHLRRPRGPHPAQRLPPVRPTLFPHHALPRSLQTRRHHWRRRRGVLATQPGVYPPSPTRGPRGARGSHSHTHQLPDRQRTVESQRRPIPDVRARVEARRRSRKQARVEVPLPAKRDVAVGHRRGDGGRGRGRARGGSRVGHLGSDRGGGRAGTEALLARASSGSGNRRMKGEKG